MQHLTEAEVEELRAALHAEKDSLEEELSEHGRKVGGDWMGTAAGFEGNEPDQRGSHRRAGRLHVQQRAGGFLRRQDVAPGFPRERPVRRAGQHR